MTDNFHRRTIEFDGTRADEDVVPCVLSTETPVDRYDYLEVLEHTDQAVDLSRAPLPLIESHDASRVNVGIVDGLRIVAGKLRGVVRFGKSARARELLADVKAGIVRGLSIGYQITATRREGNTLIATKWMPFELSCVAVPADTNAGFFRGNVSMTDTNTAGERNRVTEILAIGRIHKLTDMAEKAIADGLPLAEFRSQVLSTLASTQGRIEPGVDLSRREQKQYSVLRAINLQLDPMRATREGGLELEVSRELDRQAGTPARGIRVPMGTGRRDLTTSIGTGTSKAGYLVPTETHDLIDVLRAKMILTQLGVTRLTGLQGNITLPRKTAGATSYWVAENSAPTEGSLTFDSVSLTPKTAAAYVDFSRRFSIQSSVDAEAMVRNDLMEGMARVLDSAAIGSSVTNGPTGIRGTSGIGSVAGGTNGLAMNWANLVALQREVEIDNAAGANMAYLTNDKVKAKLLVTPRQSSGVEGNFLLNESGTIAGRPFITSNTVPSNLTKGSASAVCSAIFFGDWSQLVWGTWGNSFDLLTDPFTGSKEGTIRVVCFTDCDFGVRHPEAFAVCADVLTT